MKISHFFSILSILCLSTKGMSQNEVSSVVKIQKGIKTSCPYLTTNLQSNAVMSFVSQKNNHKGVMCYSEFSSVDGKFQSPIEIPSSQGVELHGENMPKIIFKPNNEIIAVWGVGNPSPKKKYGGLVKYAQSFDNGKNWTKAIPLVKDTASIDQRYFDIALLPNGEVAVIWLDNRSKTKAEGSTLYYAQTNGINGFQNEKPIAETTCQCCRTDLFVSKNGTINVAFRDIIDNEIRDMVLMNSTDNGQNFSVPKRISPDNWKISGCPHTGPTMTENEKGLHFAWYTSGGGSGVFYCNSADYGKEFSPRNVVSEQSTAKHPQITSINNKDVLIVWDEAFVKEDEVSTKIGLQHRNGKGEIVSTKYISPDKKLSSFPVIKTLNSKQFLVSWIEKTETSENVYYKVMSLD